MKTKIKLFALGLTTSIVFVASAAEQRAMSCCSAKAAPALTIYTDKSLFQLDSTWTTDAGKPIKLASLRGKPQVVAMFFASCQFTCPLTISDLKRIEAALPENLRGKVGFTLVSFDSERDTPAALAALRAKHELAGGDWTLLRGGADDVRELAALLGVSFRKDADGNYAHSNVLTVLNSEGEIVFQQPGINLPPEEIVAKLQTLLNK